MKAIVTRPRDDAAALVRALAERGIDAILAPMLTIQPAAHAARHLAERLTGAQAVLFTSANGVRAVAAAPPPAGRPALGGPALPSGGAGPPRVPARGHPRRAPPGLGGAGSAPPRP